MDEAARNMDANMQRGVDAMNSEIQARSGKPSVDSRLEVKTILAGRASALQLGGWKVTLVARWA